MEFTVKFNSGLKYDIDDMVEQARKLMDEGRLFCTMGKNDFPEIALDKICGKITDIQVYGKDLKVEVEYLNTPLGIVMTSLINCDAELRPMGVGIVKNNVVEDYGLIGFYLAGNEQ